MTRIQTPNLQIDRDLCQRIDRAIFNSKEPIKKHVRARYDLYRSELLESIRAYVSDDLYKIMQKKRSLYYLCGALETIRNEHGRNEQERLHANAQMARTQTKAWDWPGLK